MTKRNVGGALLGLIASITAAIASCSFPSYEIIVTGTSGSAGGESATVSSGSVGGGGNGGASSTGTTSSGAGGSGGSSSSTSSSSSTGSGGVCIGGGVGDGGACDCDDDKALATSCAMGTDCNDHNPLVYPGQKSFFKDKIVGAGNDYDYDCSGKDEYEITTVINCVGLNCNTSIVGWSGEAPACGASGKFGTCKVTGLASCAESIQGTQVQKCH